MKTFSQNLIIILIKTVLEVLPTSLAFSDPTKEKEGIV